VAVNLQVAAGVDGLDKSSEFASAARSLERFHNSRVLSGIVQDGIFLGKMPLEDGGFGVQQL
jgi:hypothetical protein